MATLKFLLFTVILVGTVKNTTQDESSEFNSENKDVQNDEESISISREYKNVKNTKSSRRRIFSGGCVHQPNSPINGNIRCSLDSGCIATCAVDYKFPNGVTQLAITCKDREWHIQGSDWHSVPHCEPICLPECQNSGICVAPHECNCPDGFKGPQCQFENKPCMSYPLPAINSMRKCSSTFCTISCMENFTFPDGSTVANMICKNGNWQPSRSDWVSIPDCSPVCSPPCQNGGVCLPRNVCQCPVDYRGPQCQYSANACAAEEKLGFNGGFHCTSNAEAYSCKLNCPLGATFEFAPADEYVCTYDKGYFEPQNIPQCKFSENVNVISVSTSYNSYIKSSNHTWFAQDILGSTNENSQGDRLKYNVTNVYETHGNSMNLNNIPYNQLENNMMIIENIKIEPKTCFVWGKTHYKTFDDKIYSFQSDCTHILVQDEESFYTIAAQDSPGCKTGGACFRIIKIFMHGNNYILHRNEDGIPELRTKHKSLAIPAKLPGLRAEVSAHFILITLDIVNVKLRWDGGLLLQIESPEVMWNKTVGLCGRMNGNPDDDLLTRSGISPKSIPTLATSWRIEEIGETCNENSNVQHACAYTPELTHDSLEFCTKLLSDRRFQSCYSTINFEELMATCLWEYCGCNNDDKRTCACDTMNVYVRQCAHKGIVSLAGWRNSETCPMSCTNGRIYMSCGPKSQPSCGAGEAEESNEGNCEEGCFCPEGSLIHKDKCIAPEECPCILRKKYFQPGSSVRKDCNTCTCLSGKWVCTQAMCSARCAVLGDPHYITFDGKRYDFMGKCKYHLLKGDDYSIEGENVACAGAISESMGFARTNLPTSCTNAVTIIVNGTVVKLKQNGQIEANGQELVKLPTLIADVKIRAASSIFTVVQLANGLDVWWDGVSRVYVNAPPTFRGKTKGLCGTFTDSQSDDFFTPYGDIERRAIPFANKWKTDEQCTDEEDEQVPKQPCSLNPQKEIDATTYCSKINSEVFADCHWHVDPEPFVKDCTYDMCACESDIKSCLCPMLAAYAKECAAAGVNLLWRESIPECALQCTGGQVYQICGNSCTRSCSDIAFNTDCRQECVEGCNCPEGQALNDNGECIPIGQCPCTYKGREFKPGYQEVRPGSKAQELCTCAGGIWSCRTATPEEIQEYQSATDLETTCVPSKHLEITVCEPVVPRTCHNMHAQATQSPAVCKSGCICKAGYVFDVPNGVCIKEKDCPCHHAGKSYKQGAVIQDDCNTCECNNSKWKCTDRICAGVCSAWGDSHFKTFDGKLYNFQGVCDYVLAKSILNKEESFDVSIQNVQCGSSGVACSKSITLTVGNNRNQETITLTRGEELPKGNFQRIAIRTAGLFVYIDVPDLGIVVQWDKGTRVYIRLDPKWKGRTKGLCGDYNDNSEDDFKTPSGGIPEVSAVLFGDSWKKSEHCREPEEVLLPCEKNRERKLWAENKCGVLKSSLFRPCHSEVDVEPYIENCIFDTCSCDYGGDCECLCTALAAYAHECNVRGVPIKWRSQDLCPIQCDEECSMYSPCISTCPRETCESVTTLKDKLHMCAQDSCVEGCLFKSCPEDQVYLNSSYSECIPKAMCKPLCTEANGMKYYEGDQVSSDGCQTCFCSRGKIICNGEPCSTTTAQPFIGLLEQSQKCTDGWTPWINKDTAVKGKKVKDVEPLPTVLDMANTNGSAVCNKENIVDIKCRSVEQHMTAKETGLDVECSLERGLYCQPRPGLPCIDFEISVLCQCPGSTTEPSGEIPSTTEGLHECDLSHPYKPHPTDCHLFYQCSPGIFNNEFVEKTCGPNMLYNHETQVCDWPATVTLLRPECSVQTTTLRTPEPTTTTSTTRKEVTPIQQTLNTSRCRDDEVWSDCAVDCQKTCEYYRFILMEQGHCIAGANCIPGCVPISKPKCPQFKLLRDNATCVDAADCTCKSRNGNSVKPGAIIKESDCEICQCINNYYTCDDSLCRTTTYNPNIFTTTKASISTTQTPEITQSAMSPTVTEHIIVVPSTVTPPSQCISEHYIPLVQHYYPTNVSFNASSSKGFMFRPENSILNSLMSADSAGGWEPEFSDTNQWLDITFKNPEPIYGIILQGSPMEEKFVTSYRVLFSENGDTFTYVLDDQNQPRVFHGPVDATEPIEQKFYTPVEAKIIRVNPLSWHNGIAIRVEILGCEEYVTTTSTENIPILSTPKMTDRIMNPVCSEPMGLDDGIMSNEQISASSSITELLPAIRLSSLHPWQPKLDNPNQYVKFDFLEPRDLTGIVTKGGDGMWTTVFTVYYSINDRDWNPVIDKNGIEMNFFGNVDDIKTKSNYFEKPLHARYLKIQPKKWHGHIALKSEIIGCFVPYPKETTEDKPQVPTEVTTTTASYPECNSCPGIVSENKFVCNCPPLHLWNGSDCVLEHNCPCVVGHIPYAVGSVYETEDCEHCICTLGGVPECSPKKCEPCTEPGTRSLVTELCACLCKPCPINTKHCPTSDVCIDDSLWCNGVQDCPDDEKNCTKPLTSTTSQHFETSKTSTTQITNQTTVQVVTVVCHDPTCPPGYKTVLKQPSHQNYGIESSANSGVKATKGSRKRYSKKRVYSPFAKGITSVEQTTPNGVECPQFTCVPQKGPPIMGQNKKEECPPVSCPENYEVVYEQMSMYKLQKCPRYTCKPPEPQEALCNVTGRTFNTFDNVEYKYDICNHILARDMFENRWYITLEKPCNLRRTSCQRLLVIAVDDNVIVLHTDMSIDINDYSFKPNQVAKLADNSGPFKISQIGDTIYFVSHYYGFWVIWDSSANVKIGVSRKLAGRVDGLCGYFDGYAANDKQMPDGSQARNTAEFGNSWVMEDTEECDLQVCPREILEQAATICNVVKDRTFLACSNAMDVNKFLSRCIEATCDCLHGNSTYDSCRCETITNFATECQAADQNVDLSNWRTAYDCIISCPAPLVYKDCFRYKCEATCNNLQEVEPCPLMKGICFPGCFCPDGLVRNNDDCVQATECRDCSCEGLGNTKIISFDKRNYEFDGNCTYILSRDVVKNAKGQDGTHKYQVLVSNVRCATGICTDAITILYQGHVIQIKRSELSQQVILNGMEIRNEESHVESWLQLKQTRDGDVILLIPEIQLELSAFHHNFAFTLKLPSHIFGDTTEGLCGNCNGDIEDDFKKPDGQITEDADVFGQSWLADQVPSLLDISLDNCISKQQNNCTIPPFDQDPCKILTSFKEFKQCHNFIDPEPYLSACHDSLCTGGSYCDSLEAYSRQCLNVGLCPNWRTHTICPYKCPPYLEYQPCGSACKETCNNLDERAEEKCSLNSVEGCFCPAGYVLHNDTCIQKEKCFVCDAEGHVENDVWHPDKCTTCNCKKGIVSCQKMECPVLDTMCAENMQLIRVSDTEEECCPKYICVPAPTEPPVCPELTQPECGFGQVMKLSPTGNGCQQFVCQCLLPEDCPAIDEVAIEIDELEPGYARIINRTGCCPRPVIICEPDTCPLPPKCPLYHTINTTHRADVCCPNHKCEPPTNVCLYNATPMNNTEDTEYVIPKKIGEEWKPDKCTTCICENSDSGAKSTCYALECPSVKDHPDISNFVIEEILVDTECCPKLERTACKDGEKIYEIGTSWQPVAEDSCITMQCINDGTGIQKQTRIQECNSTCERGYKYEPSDNSSINCCGKCIPTACIVNDELKDIGEEWYSDDHCVAYTCLLSNGTVSTRAVSESCPEVDTTELDEFVIEKRFTPGKCCPEMTRTACRHNGYIYEPGESWILPNDSCTTEKCILETNKVIKRKQVTVCSTECPVGWVYEQPKGNECCGECKQVFCVAEDVLYEPGKTWSYDNCTTFTCSKQGDQLLVSSNSIVCPDVIDCPYESIYNDQCCKQCNLTTLVPKKACAAKFLDAKDTIGILNENHHIHGICKNLMPVKEISECSGTCKSSTHFDNESWNQISDCQCCQPTEYRHVIVTLTCEDGKTMDKKLSVPISCSCTECSSANVEIKRRKSKTKSHG